MKHYAVLNTNGPVTTVTTGVRSVPAPFAGTLTALTFSVGVATAAGAATFDFNVNGVSIFSNPDDRPVLPAGQKSVSVVGLEVEFDEGDVLSWDADAVPLGGLSAPVTCSAVLDDGEDFPTELPPAGPAGGDLTGSYPDPGVASVAGKVPGSANGLATLDAGGKLPTSQLPALAISETFVVNSQAAMLALTAQRGDVALRTDVSEVYILATDDPTDIANWKLWLHPAIPTSLPPSGAAGGDLAGTFPNPTVDGLQGRSLAGIPAPPTGVVTDNFNDNSFDSSIWARDNSSHILEQNARMEFTATAGANAYMLYAFGGGRKNFTDKYVSCKNVPGGASAYIRIYLNLANDVWVEIRVGPGIGEFRFSYRTGGSTTNAGTLAYDASIVYFKISYQSSDSKFHFFTSTDGATWTDRANCTMPAGGSITQAMVTFISVNNGGTAYIDDFDSNVPTDDALASKNLYSILWDGANDRFGILRALGIIPYNASGSPPSGAPSNLLTGYTLLVWEESPTKKLWAWNPTAGTWSFQQF